MRFDKLTTKFQQAFADAQSLALGNDNGFIEPQHLLSALLNQEDGGTASLLARAGVATPRLKTALAKAIERLKSASSEIRAVARVDPVTAAEGVIALAQRIWPAFEHIDTSST